MLTSAIPGAEIIWRGCACAIDVFRRLRPRALFCGRDIGEAKKRRTSFGRCFTWSIMGFFGIVET
jgi:hypothetical protein